MLVTTTTTPSVQGVGYWPQGAVYNWQYGNNVMPVEVYTHYLQPQLAYTTLVTNQNVFSVYLGNVYNKNGTVNGIVEGYGANVAGGSLTGFNQFFTYDALNRLTNVQDNGYDRGFGYDEYGNMAVVYNSAGFQLSGLTPQIQQAGQNPFNPANNQLVGRTYDARGNMTNLGAVTMSYDGEGRQTQTVDTGTGQTISYLYDGLGQRVQKSVSGGGTTIYVHDAFGQLAAEYDSAAVTTLCTTCYLSYDQLGSTREITDQNGSVVARDR